MNNKIKITLILIISLIWGIAIYQNSLGNVIKNINTNNVHSSSQKSIRTPTVPITKNTKVKDYFTGQYNNLNSISVRVGNYGRLNTSNLCITLTNLSTKTQLYLKCQAAVNFVNNALYQIPFKNELYSKGQKFLLDIYSYNATAKNSVALWSFKNGNNKNNQLYINNKLQKNNLDLIQTYNDNYSFFKSLQIIYQRLYQTNPYFLHGKYIYMVVLLYPTVLLILLTLFEFLFLYNKSVKNIILTNLLFAIILLSIDYYVYHVQNLTIPNVKLVLPHN